MNTDAGPRGTGNTLATPKDRGIIFFKESEVEPIRAPVRHFAFKEGEDEPITGNVPQSIDEKQLREMNIGLQLQPSINPQKIREGPLKGATAPRVQKEGERRNSIIKREPAIFEIAENPDVKKVWHLGGITGTFEEVTKYADIIEREAKRQGLDADFVKAVVYMESSHTTGFEPVVQGLGFTLGKSPRPMNVTANTWGKDLGIPKEELTDPQINIEVGTFILGEIWKRTHNPTPEKVGTLYQNLGAIRVSDVGKSVDYYYRTKPWEKATK